MDEPARRAVSEAGYDYGCAVDASLAEIGPTSLPRFYVGQADDAPRLAAKRILYRGRIALRSLPDYFTLRSSANPAA
jgi:hypothetical protein